MLNVKDMPDNVTIWAEIEGQMQQVGRRVRQDNGKLRVKWRLPYSVLSMKTLFLQPAE